jgi:hypothetical protein
VDGDTERQEHGRVDLQGISPRAIEPAVTFLCHPPSSATSEIYGDPEVHPRTKGCHRDNLNTIGLRSCYDEVKSLPGTLVTDFGARHMLSCATQACADAVRLVGKGEVCQDVHEVERVAGPARAEVSAGAFSLGV